ncbi:B3 domain-containing transcription factor VRN1-like [Euphorbia lathyris]|uniref:B3 domain-containing transcription factor VRN1-like n=1 Tax=Euphorbia lathyris TaxID=212925 RepID=UPI0033132880
MAGRRKMQPSDHRRSNCTVDRPPLCHFFKIILASTIEERKLLVQHIPRKFVKEFGDELTDVADLIVPNGRVWKVGLSKERNNIWFDDGWQMFAEHHSICHGHLLVFAYTGFCSFNVFIFDTTASEIEYPCNNEGPSFNENGGIRNEVEMQDDNPSEMLLNSITSSTSNRSLKRKLSDASATKRDSSETHPKSEPELRMKRRSGTGTASMVIQDFEHLGTRNKRLKVEHSVEKTDIDDNETRKKLRKGKPGNLKLDEPLADEQKSSKITSRSDETESLAECEDKKVEIITSGRFELNDATPESARAICAAKKYMPKNPSFMVVLTAANVRTSKLYVPLRFGKYLKDVSLIKLQVSDAREWEVILYKKYKRCDFGVGWSTFCRDNNLNEGDVCVFELVKNKEVLKVSIFHAI